MSKVNSNVPSTEQLTEILFDLMCKNGLPARQIEIAHRAPNDYASSYPTEILDCRFPDGSTLHLFCKYSTDWDEEMHSHRRSIAYEGQVYAHVLQNTDLSKPRFYGIHCGTDCTVLVIEHLQCAQQISKVRTQSLDAMQKAAQWIGKFHQYNETKGRDSAFPSIIFYTHEYYAGWVDRTLKFTREVAKTGHFPWLEELCDNFKTNIALLLEASPTVIHGEYYSQNILFQNNNIYPIDWQSAAVACGEIDLASLTEWWEPGIEQACIDEYKRARWPLGAPDFFDDAFLMAKLYWEFRWLGMLHDHAYNEMTALRFDTLFSLGKRMGLI